MASPDHRLAILAATLAPGSAGALLRLLSSAGAREAQEQAQELSKRSRAERLEALASVLSEATGERPASLDAAAAAERPRIAQALLALAHPPPHDDAPYGQPTLARLLAERSWSR